MASKSHREMATAVAFAEVFSKQLKSYYLENKPRAKKIHPLLDAVIDAADEQLEYFRKDLTERDVLVYISKKVDAFNASTENSMGQKEAVGFIIGLLSERVCELNEKGSKTGKMERMESVLKPMERLYEYFDRVDKQDVEEESTGLFRAWEAA